MKIYDMAYELGRSWGFNLKFPECIFEDDFLKQPKKEDTMLDQKNEDQKKTAKIINEAFDSLRAVKDRIEVMDDVIVNLQKEINLERDKKSIDPYALDHMRKELIKKDEEINKLKEELSRKDVKIQTLIKENLEIHLSLIKSENAIKDQKSKYEAILLEKSNSDDLLAGCMDGANKTLEKLMVSEDEVKRLKSRIEFFESLDKTVKLNYAKCVCGVNFSDYQEQRISQLRSENDRLKNEMCYCQQFIESQDKAIERLKFQIKHRL